MKKLSSLLLIVLVLFSANAHAQTSGLNLGSLQNLSGLSQLYGLVPSSSTPNLSTSTTPKEEDNGADVPTDGTLSNEESYFINQLQGIIMAAVIDSLKNEDDSSPDSIYKALIFGHQFFRIKSLGVFTKSDKVKAPDTYTLDSGDELSLSVWGYSAYNAKMEINDEGFVDIPEVGRIYLKGVTFGAAKKLIQQRIGRFIDTKSSSIEIVLNYSRNITVNIVGDVNEPGSYVIPAINSVFNALSAAKGPSQIGSIRNVQVKRNGQTVKEMDLYEFLLSGNISNDFYLQDGDYIFVPTIEKVVEIKGSVRRPWKYELKGKETLADLIRMAGGFGANAYTSSIQLKRFEQDKVEIQDIDLAKIGGGSSFELIDGDEVFVPNIPTDFQNFVQVSGAVRFPGQYEWKENFRIADLIASAGGLRLDAYLERAYLTRYNEDLTKNIQNFNLRSVVFESQNAENVLLQGRDHIEIFSKKQFLEEFKVSIEGAVLKPVVKSYADGMTLNDLIFYSGGLKKEAANKVIEISRVAKKEENGEEILMRVIVKRIEVSAALEIDEASKAFPLSPMDEVFVRSNPDFEKQKNITVKGEVMFPGVYPILQKDEKVLDLIERAGGLTKYAFIQSAKLYRKDATIGMVIIDLEEAYRSPDARPNYILKPGDMIEIPTVNQLVSVSGAIGHPELDTLGTVSSFYMPGRRAKYYVKNYGGGFDKGAKRKSTKVVNPDGSADYTKKVIFFNRYPEVKEGASVMVEYKRTTERKRVRTESAREPINFNLLLPAIITGTASLVSSTIVLIVLQGN